MVRIKYKGPEFEVELPESGPDGVELSAMLLTGKVPQSRATPLIPPPNAQRLLSPPNAQPIRQLEDDTPADETLTAELVPSEPSASSFTSPKTKNYSLFRSLLAGGFVGLVILASVLFLHERGWWSSGPSESPAEAVEVEPLPTDELGVPLDPPPSNLPPWPPDPTPGLKRDGD